jgi:hypothetical protein
MFVRGCDFIGTEFRGKLFFTNARFLQGATFETDYRMPEVERYSLLQSEIEACKVMRMSYERQGDRAAADILFVREMRARRKERDNALICFFEKLLVDNTCRYGTDWLAIIRASIVVLITFSLLYYISNFNMAYYGSYGQASFSAWSMEFSGRALLNMLKMLLESLYFSFATFTTLGSNNFSPTGLIRFIATIEAFLGAFFIALIVAVFSRKWMR